jgi:hypothetical protein
VSDRAAFSSSCYHSASFWPCSDVEPIRPPNDGMQQSSRCSSRGADGQDLAVAERRTLTRLAGDPQQRKTPPKLMTGLSGLQRVRCWGGIVDCGKPACYFTEAMAPGAPGSLVAHRRVRPRWKPVRSVLSGSTWANGQGSTRDEARDNLAEAIALILEDRREDGLRGVPADAEREIVTVNIRGAA